MIGRKDILLHAIALLIIVIFFLPLFYPTLSLFVTPEVGVSDLWQFNLPVKLLMSNALHAGHVPLWTPMIGTGFPIFAESQMGFFNAFLLFLYSIFPLVIAFNLEFIIIFFTAFSGMYFFLRHLKTSYTAAFLGGFSFTFSGFFIAHISHQNMLLSCAYIPWIFLVTELFFSTKKIRYFLLGVLIISQQILGGHIQMTFTTLVFVGLYILVCGYIQKITRKQYIYRNICLAAMVLLAAVISAVQLLPTSELINHSVRKSGLLPAENIQYSFPIKHFLTFLDPFLLGSPKNGTYPHYIKNDGSIFWENTGYIGLIPLGLALFSLLAIRKKKKTLSFFILLVSSAFIMTGKYSPFYFIHTLPLFNGFRVPSRYIIIFIFALCTLAAFGLDEFIAILNKRSSKKGAFIGILLVILSIVNIFYIWGDYHLIAKASTWFSDSETGTYIKKANTDGRILSLKNPTHFVDYFLRYGWDKKSSYSYFRNGLLSNYNIIEGIPDYGAYVGKVDLNRYIAYRDAMLAEILLSEESDIHISTTSAKLLGLANVRYFISMSKVDTDSFTKKFQTTKNPDGLPPHMVYENKYFVLRARMLYDFVVKKTVESIQQTVISNNFDGTKTVILEQDPKQNFHKACIDSPDACSSNVSITHETDTKITIQTNNKQSGLLILADTYYPGWRATIDNNSTPIYAANLNQRAIVVPAGKHAVLFEYVPESFYRGLLISIIGYITIISLLIVDWRTTFLDTVSRKVRLFDRL